MKPSTPAEPISTTSLLTKELTDVVDLIRHNRVNLRRRIKQISLAQRTTLGTDAIQSRLCEESIAIQDSLMGGLDKIAKSLLRPQGIPEPTPDTDAIMQELMKGRK